MRSIGRVVLAASVLLGACGGHGAEGSAPARPREPIVGGPCEGCEAVFEGLPATLATRARIAPENEPGEGMRIDGVVRDRAGRPAAGVIVYAYHTDAQGIYPHGDRSPGPSAYRHGRLRGWARTDEQGRYHFDTIRPAGYPHTTIPSHVHMHVIEPGRCSYFIGDILFDDDPRLTPAERARASDRGGSGVAKPVKDADGVWSVTRDIVLGAGVPGYPD